MKKPALYKLETLVHKASTTSFDVAIAMAVIQTAINDNVFVGDNKVPAKELKNKLLNNTKELWDTMLDICSALGELQSEIKD